MKPKISFVMPEYNRGELIGETIQSILNQTFSDWELVVVNDHSDPKDRTEEVIKSFSDKRIRYFELPDLKGRGVSCGRNFGNAQAKGEIIAVCDSDDYYLPKRAELIINSYKKNKWDVFYGKYLAYKAGEKEYDRTGYMSKHFSLERFKERNYIPNGSSAYTCNIAFHYPYNSCLNRGEDYDFFTRIAVDNKKFYYCPEYIYKYRIHEESLTEGKKDIITEDFIKRNRNWV